jgi:hypothetical protein
VPVPQAFLAKVTLVTLMTDEKNRQPEKFLFLRVWSPLPLAAGGEAGSEKSYF